MSTNEHLTSHPSPEEQFANTVDEILAAESKLPQQSLRWPRYWYREQRKNSVFGVTSSLITAEGATKKLPDGNRVDIFASTRMPSILGIRLPAHRSYGITRWDKETEGSYKLDVDLDRGWVEITSRTQDPIDRGVLLPFEKVTFRKGMPEYEETIRTMTTILGEVNETG